MAVVFNIGTVFVMSIVARLNKGDGKNKKIINNKKQ